MKKLHLSNGGVVGEMIRYGLSGLLLAAAYAVVYWTLAVPLGVPVFAANTVAFLTNLGLAWLLHSRWSFRSYVRKGQSKAAYPIFALINLFAFILNSFWVWLTIEHLGGSVDISIVPIVTITPLINFGLTRLFVFHPSRRHGS